MPIVEESRLSPSMHGRGAPSHGHLLLFGKYLARAGVRNLSPVVEGQIPRRGIPLAVYGAQAIADASVAFWAKDEELIEAAKLLLSGSDKAKIKDFLGAKSDEDAIAKLIGYTKAIKESVGHLVAGFGSLGSPLAGDISVLKVVARLPNAIIDDLLEIEKQFIRPDAVNAKDVAKAVDAFAVRSGLARIRGEVDSLFTTKAIPKKMAQKIRRYIRQIERASADLFAHPAVAVSGDQAARLALRDKLVNTISRNAQKLAEIAAKLPERLEKEAEKRKLEAISLSDEARHLSLTLRRLPEESIRQLRQQFDKSLKSVIGQTPRSRLFSAIDTAWVDPNTLAANLERAIRLGVAVNAPVTLQGLSKFAATIMAHITSHFGKNPSQYPEEVRSTYLMLSRLQEAANILSKAGDGDAAGLLVHYGPQSARESILPPSPTHLLRVRPRGNLLLRTFEAYRTLAKDPKADVLVRLYADATRAAKPGFMQPMAESAIRANTLLAASGYLAAQRPELFKDLIYTFDTLIDTTDYKSFTPALRATQPIRKQPWHQYTEEEIGAAARSGAGEAEEGPFGKAVATTTRKKIPYKLPQSKLRWSLELSSYSVAESEAAAERLVSRVLEESTARIMSGTAMKYVPPAEHGGEPPVYLTEADRAIATGFLLGQQAVDFTKPTKRNVFNALSGVVAKYIPEPIGGITAQWKRLEGQKRQYQLLALNLGVQRLLTGEAPAGFETLAEEAAKVLVRHRKEDVRGTVIEAKLTRIALAAIRLAEKLEKAPTTNEKAKQKAHKEARKILSGLLNGIKALREPGKPAQVAQAERFRGIVDHTVQLISDFATAIDRTTTLEQAREVVRTIGSQLGTPAAYTPIAGFIDPSSAIEDAIREYAEALGKTGDQVIAKKAGEKALANLLIRDISAIIEAGRGYERSPDLLALKLALDKTQNISDPVERLGHLASYIRNSLPKDSAAGLRLMSVPLGSLAATGAPEEIAQIGRRLSELGPSLTRVSLFLDTMTAPDLDTIKELARHLPARYAYLTHAARRLAGIRPPMADPRHIDFPAIIATAASIRVNEDGGIESTVRPKGGVAAVVHDAALIDTNYARATGKFDVQSWSSDRTVRYYSLFEPNSILGRTFRAANNLALALDLPVPAAEILQQRIPALSDVTLSAVAATALARQHSYNIGEQIRQWTTREKKQPEAPQPEAAATAPTAAAPPAPTPPPAQPPPPAPTAAAPEAQPAQPPAEPPKPEAKEPQPEEKKGVPIPPTIRLPLDTPLPKYDPAAKLPPQYEGPPPAAATLQPVVEGPTKISPSVFEGVLPKEDVAPATAESLFQRYKKIGGLHESADQAIQEILKALGLPVPASKAERAALYAVFTHGWEKMPVVAGKELKTVLERLPEAKQYLQQLIGDLPDKNKITLADLMRVMGGLRVLKTRYANFFYRGQPPEGVQYETVGSLVVPPPKPTEEKPAAKAEQPASAQAAPAAAAPPPQAQAPPAPPPEKPREEAKRQKQKKEQKPTAPAAPAPTAPAPPPVSPVAGAPATPVPPGPAPADTTVGLPPQPIVEARIKDVAAEAVESVIEAKERQPGSAFDRQAQEGPTHGRPLREPTVPDEALALLRRLAEKEEVAAEATVEPTRAATAISEKAITEAADKEEKVATELAKSAMAYINEMEWKNDLTLVADKLTRALESGDPQLEQSALADLEAIAEKIKSRQELGLQSRKKWVVRDQLARPFVEYLRAKADRIDWTNPDDLARVAKIAKVVTDAFDPDQTLSANVQVETGRILASVKEGQKLLTELEDKFAVNPRGLATLANIAAEARRRGQAVDPAVDDLLQAIRLWATQMKPMSPTLPGLPERRPPVNRTLDSLLAKLAPEVTPLVPQPPKPAEEPVTPAAPAPPPQPTPPVAPAGWGRRAGVYALATLGLLGLGAFLSNVFGRKTVAEQTLQPNLEPVGVTEEGYLVYPGGLTVRPGARMVELP